MLTMDSILAKTPKAQIACAILISLLVVFIKADNLGFVINSLWAEDGRIFLNDAYAIGYRSFFEPYAGYLHTWPRIVAILSTNFSLTMAPYVFFLGWFAAIAIAVWSVLEVGRLYKIPAPVTLIASILVFLPPHTDEVYFNLTNSQWFLAIYLSIIMLVGTAIGGVQLIMIFVSAATGPFSIVLAPFLIFRMIFKQPTTGKLSIFLLLLGASIQVLFLAFSGRETDSGINLEFQPWLDVVWRFFVFSGEKVFEVMVAVIYWLLVLFLLWSCLKQPRSRGSRKIISVLIFGGVIFAASLWSVKNNPAVIDPLGVGARYFFVPYALSLLFCLSSYNLNRGVSIASMSLFLWISANVFVHYDRSETYFKEYSSVHEQLGGFYIPIHPRSPFYPGWGFKAREWDESFFDRHHVHLDKLSIPKGSADGQRIQWYDSRDPNILFAEPVSCPTGSVIVLVVALDNEVSGWNQLFWASNDMFSEEKSFALYRNQGMSRLVYAIPAGQLLKIRFDPPGGTKVINNFSADYLCVD